MVPPAQRDVCRSVRSLQLVAFINSVQERNSDAAEGELLEFG